MRHIIRAFLVIALLLVVGFVVFGWTDAPWRNAATSPAGSVGTTGAAATERARERGAELGEKAAVAAEEVGKNIGEAAVTAKIKAKMALDDSVRARTVDVSTTGTTVTLNGNVRSVTERDRAIALARETDGVKRVVDHLVVVP
jgi:osmotically-inducible protein OsmY